MESFISNGICFATSRFEVPPSNTMQSPSLNKGITFVAICCLMAVAVFNRSVNSKLMPDLDIAPPCTFVSSPLLFSSFRSLLIVSSETSYSRLSEVT